MVGINDTMKNIIDKCDLLLEGEVFSRELLLQSFAEFLSKTINNEKHCVGLVLHTGSICFDAVILIYAAISNLIFNKSNADVLVMSLQHGDSVLFGELKKERYTFEGFATIEGSPKDYYVVLSQGQSSRRFVPPKRWRLILPYYGDSERFDGRGFRKGSSVRDDFFKEVLNYDEDRIPSVIDTSTVIVMPRDFADRLINQLSIRFGHKEIRLLELVTVSYYSENDEYYYGGNTGKIEPSIKVTGKVSVARQLILKRNGNHNIGLIVLGNDSITRGYSELPELLDRKSIQYVCISTNLDSEYGTSIIDNQKEISVFACTKKNLRSNFIQPIIANRFTCELSNQVDIIIRKELIPHALPGFLTWDKNCLFKKSMIAIKCSDYESDEKNQFIVQAYSLMNLFLTAVFSINDVEQMIKDGMIEIESPEKRIKTLMQNATCFPTALKDYANNVLECLEKAYINLAEQSEKEKYLREYLAKHHDLTIAVIVPKAYYVLILEQHGVYDLVYDRTNLTVVTANRFNNTIIYDAIVVLGDFKGKRFDAFRCKASQRIEILLYEFELELYTYKMKDAKKIEQLYNLHSIISIRSDDESEEYNIKLASEKEVLEIQQIDEELDSYVTYLNELADIRGLSYWNCSLPYITTTEVIAIVTFESGEKAFLTKMYKAYVMSEGSSEVHEVRPYELREGDSVVFTLNNLETRDFVDNVLNYLIEKRKFPQKIIDCYGMSKHWKHTLIEYMRKNKVSAKAVASVMIKNGVAVQEATIRTWLDEDSHTVGPRKVDSIQQIALLTDDEDMFEYAEKYFEACKIIRTIRRDILKKIGNIIIDKLCGRIPQAGTELADIFGRIDTLVMVLKIEKITYTTVDIPLNATNRPINM